eukprot:TRINITY_DN65559_c0_g1_i1.p1 TRINITY_DN65559_c0_g1~~TRINITY_DN65559_c0_g1_i1.p1  ORF type:complete len:583 (+),score=101.63 TRINITY_DN65559_c0_g1_i1:211-1959(+)
MSPVSPAAGMRSDFSGGQSSIISPSMPSPSMGLRRCLSERSGTFGLGGLGCGAGLGSPGRVSRSPSPEGSLVNGCVPRENVDCKQPKRKALLSARMTNGDSMREALTAAPPRAARGPRMRSLPPRTCGGWDDETSSLASWRTGDSNRPQSSRSSLLNPEHHRDLFRSGSARSVNSESGLRSLSPRSETSWDPRARRPASAFSADRSDCSFRSSQAPSCAQDHLWRELFHQEADERKAARVRGRGQAIASRGKSSAGIPWRQIPVYDRIGLMSETGDPYYQEHTRNAVAMTSKRKGVFSPKFQQLSGVRDLLAPVSESAMLRIAEDPVSPSVSSQMNGRGGGCSTSSQASQAEARSEPVSAREAWLEVVKRRYQAAHPNRAGSSVNGQSVASANGGAQTPSEYAADSIAESARSSVHYSYRPQKRSPPVAGYNPEAGNTKDACPYNRDDSTPDRRSCQATTPHRRDVLSPKDKIAGAAAIIRNGDDRSHGLGTARSGYAPEKVPEARRDFQYQQDRDTQVLTVQMMQDESAYLQPLANSSSARSLQPSSSLQDFSDATVASRTSPVHSVRVRISTSKEKARWK